MEQIVSLISAFFTEPGPGGIFVLLVISLAGAVYFILIRWILQGDESGLPIPSKMLKSYRQLSSRR